MHKKCEQQKHNDWWLHELCAWNENKSECMCCACGLISLLFVVITNQYTRCARHNTQRHVTYWIYRACRSRALHFMFPLVSCFCMHMTLYALSVLPITNTNNKKRNTAADHKSRMLEWQGMQWLMVTWVACLKWKHEVPVWTRRACWVLTKANQNACGCAWWFISSLFVVICWSARMIN